MTRSEAVTKLSSSLLTKVPDSEALLPPGSSHASNVSICLSLFGPSAFVLAVEAFDLRPLAEISLIESLRQLFSSR